MSGQSQAQISATISAVTKAMLDRFTQSRGLKKGFVVEAALRMFMESRRELPDEAFIPTRIVLDNESFDRLVDLLDDAPPPSDALRELMRDGRD